MTLPTILLSPIIFYFLAIALIASAFVVVFGRNIFRCALGLTATLSVVSAIFAFLGADFLASSQLLLYVGGVMIIMLFVIMLSQRPLEETQSQTNNQWIWGLVLASAVTATLIGTFHRSFPAITVAHEPGPTSAAIGRLLMGKMLVPFEIISLVLLAALVGAVVFSQDRNKADDR
jgi:NAD(P)H-quinone oxidoreductase subunit 6